MTCPTMTLWLSYTAKPLCELILRELLHSPRSPMHLPIASHINTPKELMVIQVNIRLQSVYYEYL